MLVEKLEVSDVERAIKLQPHDWGSIEAHVNFYVRSSICRPVKISEGNEIIGIGTSILHKDVAWLAAIIVHPYHRGKGIGPIITQFQVEDLKKSGYESIYLIVTPLGDPVYTKLGFKIQDEYSFRRNDKEYKKFAVNPNIIPYLEEYKKAIFELDKIASGEDRSVRFPDYLHYAFVFNSDSEIQGFYLPDFYEGLIVAANEYAGIELMKLRLNSKNFGILPFANKVALDFLSENNFNEFRTAKRMYLGKMFDWSPELIYNRVSGQIG